MNIDKSINMIVVYLLLLLDCGSQVSNSSCYHSLMIVTTIELDHFVAVQLKAEKRAEPLPHMLALLHELGLNELHNLKLPSQFGLD